jgi:hypothetical protein
VKRIFVPTKDASNWKEFLAEPDKQWKIGYSARTLANCWEDANGEFPNCIQKVFSNHKNMIGEIKPLLIFPEYKVSLPGGIRESQNDVFVLAKNDINIITIAVEGKVSESFGPTLGEWFKGASEGKKERMEYIKSLLNLKIELDPNLRYQLFHRTASALIEAEKYNTKSAMLLIHSFSEENKWIEDYKKFIALFGLKSDVNELSVFQINDRNLFFCWVKGDLKYLKY